jgi:hypothetical protein
LVNLGWIVIGIVVIVATFGIVYWMESNIPEPTDFLDLNDSFELMRLMGMIIGSTMVIVGLILRPKNNP